MTPTLVVLLGVGALIACGVYLLLERGLVRVLLGLMLTSNAVNLLILTIGGPAGRPPQLDGTPAAEMSDPLPQIMILTAIVITLGTSAFLLAMAHRNWQLTGNDNVQDDVEDRRIVTAAASDELPGGEDSNDPDDDADRAA